MHVTGKATMRNLAPALAGLLLAATFAVTHAVHAAEPVGQVTHLSGLLTAKRADGSSKVIAVKSEVQEGDTLSTEKETYARLKFTDGGEVVLRPGSQLQIEAYGFSQSKPESDNVILNVLKGGLRAVTGLVGKRNRDAVKFGTGMATIGIRGTHFGALICQDDCGSVPTASGKPPENGLHLDVSDGAVVVKNGAGEQVVNSGQFGYVRNVSTPPVVVPPQQGIQVTMPQNISQNKSDGRGLGKAKDGECVVQ
jgi:hypothetical protein